MADEVMHASVQEALDLFYNCEPPANIREEWVRACAGALDEEIETLRADLDAVNAELAALKDRIANGKRIEVDPVGTEVFLDGDDYRVAIILAEPGTQQG